VVFCVTMAYSVVGDYQADVSVTNVTRTRLHGVTTLKTTVVIFISIENINLM
jgi:hypothetical protein